MNPQKNHKHLIAAREIPKAVRQIVSTLNYHGHDAKVVGGCIRDLLLGVQPKDFDVVTDAEPERVKDVLSGSRIIGRRFKLVHVRRGQNLIEVSTYRRRAKRKTTGRSKRQYLNLYGSIEDDFSMRDFTVNALYYDLQSKRVIDYVDGLQDIENRTLRCIGIPRERFVEDPCRILRAVRFLAKLPLKLEPTLEVAIRKQKGLIPNLKPARLHNELEKMFLAGNAVATYKKLASLNILEELFPGSEDDGKLATSAMLSTDTRVGEGKPVTLGFLIAAIHWNQFRHLGKYDSAGRMSISNALESANTIIKRQREVLNLPNYIRDFIRDTWTLQTQLERRRPKRISELLVHHRFRAAYDLLVLRAATGDADKNMAQWWTQIQEMDDQQRDAAILERESRPKRKRRRRKGSSEPTSIPFSARTHPHLIRV